MIRYLILLFVILSCSKEVKKQTQTNTCIQKQIRLKTLFEDNICKIYGDNTVLSKKEILQVWNSKKRKTPTNLMLAKAFIESSFRPHIYRYEKHLEYLNYKDSLSITDCGLFQVMGFAIPKISNVNDFPIEAQMCVFDSMMANCMLRANNDIRKAVFYYNTPYSSYYPNFNSEYTIQIMNKIKLNKI
jgi:hypothetical protein